MGHHNIARSFCVDISIILVLAFVLPFPSFGEGLSVLESSQNDLIVKFNLPQVKYGQTNVNGQIFQTIEVDGCDLSDEPALPKLPIKTAIIGIPKDADPKVQIINVQVSTESVKYPIVLNEGPSNVKDTITRIKGLYPEKIAEVEPLGYLRQQRIARLRICPIQYNPVTGQLKVHKVIEIKVLFEIERWKDITPNGDPLYEDIYKDMLLNYEQAKRWRVKRHSEEYRLAPSSVIPGIQTSAYKMIIQKSGIYRLDYPYLVGAGINPSDIDPRKIEIRCGGKQVPIYVEGYEDGRFDPSDYIEFYGSKIDSIYTNSNVYWLILGSASDTTKSWLMAVKDGSVKSDSRAPVAFLDTKHIEVDRDYDPLKKLTLETADHFFWKAFRGKDPRNDNNKDTPIEIALPYRAPNITSEFKLRVCFQGITYQKGASKHVMKVYLNGNLLNTAVWEGQTEYISESSIPQYEIHRSNWLVIECHDDNGTVENPEDSSMPKWDVYLNWVEVDYWREFVAEQDILEFSTETIPPITKPSLFTVSGLSSPDVEVFQLGKLGAVAKIVNLKVDHKENSYTVSFEDEIEQPTKYYVTTRTALLRPVNIYRDNPSSLRDPANKADYIMITHKDFINGTNRLANYRREQGLDVIVVNVEDIYDEFNYGIFDPKAIKRFLGYAYFNWAKAPSYVLLVGDAHWDYKYVFDAYYRKYPRYPKIFVPTYHAQSYPYGETALDHRFVTIAGDDLLPDMMIGRIPAETAEEMEVIVSKIIEYETKLNPDLWQTRIVLCADDERSKSGDEIFEDSSVEITNNCIPYGYEVLDVYLRRIREPYLARQMIIKNINQGAIILQYAGHGGSYHWAHEGIFDHQDVYKLQNTAYPFIITTTCENGYFDNPQGGNKSLSELFIFLPNHGAIACLSATRLTYGQGNAVFSKILFNKIFSENPPILGKIVDKAKIDFIKMEISAWTSSAEQYTIFGDPAMKLALPEMKVECELAQSSIDQSQKITIKSGTVDRPRLGQKGEIEWVTDTSFNSQMRITIVYPNNLNDDKSDDIPPQVEIVKVWKGEFRDVSISVPKGVIAGEGRIKFYAVSGNQTAIGGIKFTISKPIIELRMAKILNDETLQVFASIIDNKGVSGIKSVKCEWHDTESWKWNTYDMEPGAPPEDAPRVEGTWFVTGQKISLPKPGASVDYRIMVYDDEGNLVITQLETVKVPVGVNLALTRPFVHVAPDIAYLYDHVEGAWTLSVPVENNGTREIKKPVAVYFFEGNPDRDNDNVVDQDARMIGVDVIEYSRWQPGTGQTPVIQQAKSVIKLREPLYAGFHQIFVWINPKVDKPFALPGVTRVEDNDESDNKGSKLFQINEFLVGGGNLDTHARSLDGSFGITVPAGAISETVMSITELSKPVSYWTQPDLTDGPLPGYGTSNGAFKVQLSSGETNMVKNAKIDIKFDVSGLREIAKNAKGLQGKKYLTYTEELWIQSAIEEEAKKLSIYEWLDDVGAWRRIPSELVMSSAGSSGTIEKTFAREYYVTPVSSTNKDQDFNIDKSDVSIDPISTPAGYWVIFFIDEERYKVFFKRKDSPSYETMSRYGEINKLYVIPDLGVQIRLDSEKRRFSYGDKFQFETYIDVDGTAVLRDFKNYNDGDGTVHVTMLKDDPDIQQTLGHWSIFFISAKNYEVLDQFGNALVDNDGLNLTGTVGSELKVPNLGIKIEIHDGRYPFRFGDRFTFHTLLVGTVTAEINRVGTFALMHSNDVVSPNIQLWVNGSSVQYGSVIPPRPSISILLSDANGVDMKSFLFLISVNGRDFHPVPKDDYVVSDRGQLDNIPLFYTPILDIGSYKYRLSVRDFNGNSTVGEKSDYIEFFFLVEEKPDLNPPKITATVDGLPLTNGQVIHKSPKLVINISDDHSINKSGIVLMFAPQGVELSPVSESEYRLNFSSDLKNVTITYEPELINGVYQIQVKASDASDNMAYLSPPELGPISFVLDEKVEAKEIMNHPNPFSDRTFFCYYLTQPADKVIIKIYTIRGKLVRTLIQESPKWKYNEELWDGKDEDGYDLASGVYLYKMTIYDDDRKIEKVGKLAILR